MGAVRKMIRLYLRKPLGRLRHSAQGIIEFAFISLILFTLLLGILEMGRMMFLFSQVASAAQEATRFAVIHPYQIMPLGDDCSNPPLCTQRAYPTAAHTDNPCNIVYQGRIRTVLVPTNTISIEVGYDHGDSTPANVFPLQSPPGFTPGTDRVVVTATYQFHFLTGLIDNFAPNGIDLRMVSARTIMADEENAPSPAECPEYPTSAPGGGT